MQMILKFFAMGVLAFGLSESALAQGCPTDYPQEYCDYWNMSDPNSAYFFSWYLDKPAEVDTSYLASTVFFMEERLEPVPFGAIVFSNGLPYTLEEFNLWVDDIDQMIEDASNQEEMNVVWGMLEFAATEVDRLEHLAWVIVLARQADHPGVANLTISEIIGGEHLQAF
ncbi:MAG: hypothetical protein R2827_13810 [Bdellovibrionales bacterium]